MNNEAAGEMIPLQPVGKKLDSSIILIEENSSVRTAARYRCQTKWLLIFGLLITCLTLFIVSVSNSGNQTRSEQYENLGSTLLNLYELGNKTEDRDRNRNRYIDIYIYIYI